MADSWSFAFTCRWTCRDDKRVTAAAHFFPHMLHALALRADFVPCLSGTCGLLRGCGLFVTLDAFQAFRIRLAYRALRVNSCGGVRDFSTHRAAFSQPILIQWYGLSSIQSCLLKHL